jgi:hypothetical protein
MHTTITTDIAKRETLAAMIGAYQQATGMVEQAYDILEQAQNTMRAMFLDRPGYRFSVTERNSTDVGKIASKAINSSIKKDAWAVIVERMELRRLLSIQRRTELDSQIEKGELPDLTDENVLALFETSAANVNVYMKEAVQEVFEYLRPPQSRHKTNTEYELGKRVILTWQVEKGWGRGKFSVNYHREKYLTALDNVFHMIDGKGPIKSYRGSLYDAITDSPDGTGKTDYFKFRCCMNGNLHLEFLKPELVAKLNAVAGGNRLRNQE